MVRFLGATILCLAMLATAPCPLPALNRSEPAASYLRTYYTVEDGLPSNIVNEIVQTRNGSLWIGSDAGLARFNGRTFIPIYFRGPAPVSQGGVHALAEGPDGDLWIGTRAGLARISRTGLDHFEQSSSTLYHLGAGRSDAITSLHFSHSGTLWVGTNAGLYRFTGAVFVPALPRSDIFRIEETAAGHLLVVCALGFFEIQGTQIITHPGLTTRLGIGATGLFHVLEDHTGAMWYGTGAGLASSQGDRLQRFPPYGTSGAPGAIRVYEDRQENIWVVMSNGVFRATASGLEPLTPHTQAKVLYADGDGNLWIGTNGEGLMRVKDRQVRMFTKSDGLPNDIPMTVLSRQDGSLWVGNNCGGLSSFDGKRFKTYDEKSGLSNSCVWALAEDHTGDLWVGTWGGGLYRFANGHFTQYSKPQGLLSDIVRGVIVAPDDSLWIATGGGLAHMRNGRFRNYTVIDGLSSNNVIAVYQDRHGGLWAGTNTGVDHMTGDRFKPVLSSREIFDPRLVSFGEDSIGDLYSLATPKGIDRIEGNRLFNLDQDLDLLSMIPFGRQDLWFSGERGIYRIPVAAFQQTDRERDSPLDYTSFGPADGLPSTQCSIGAPNMALTRDGKLWIATVQGLAKLDLPRLPHVRGKPTVFVEEVIVGRTRQPAGRELVLPPGSHHVELQFVSVSLTSPEKIRFQYRLDGVDPLWLDADSTRRAVYTNIPLGDHSFHVRACNSAGVWELTGITYSVTQQPYFYETGWFRLACVAALALIIFSAYWLRLRQMSIQMNARFDERLGERMLLARELHDTLLQTIQASKMLAESALTAPDSQNSRRTLERLSS